mgnify:CR=1 FL=1
MQGWFFFFISNRLEKLWRRQLHAEMPCRILGQTKKRNIIIGPDIAICKFYFWTSTTFTWWCLIESFLACVSHYGLAIGNWDHCVAQTRYCRNGVSYRKPCHLIVTGSCWQMNDLLSLNDLRFDTNYVIWGPCYDTTQGYLGWTMQ